MKKFKNLLLVAFVGMLFAVPNVFAADEVATINGQTGYESLKTALDTANAGDVVDIIQNVDVGEALTVKEGVTLRTTTNTLTINADKTLTINGTLETSSNGKIINNGIVTIDKGKLIVASSFKNNSSATLNLNNQSDVTIDGTLDLAVNSKVVTDSTTSNIKINEGGALLGNASSLDTASNATIKNYGGRLSSAISQKSNVTQYPIYDSESGEYYEKWDDLTGPKEVDVIAPITINGDSTVPEYVTLNVKSGNSININGTLTLEGTIDVSANATSLVVSNLKGSGYVYIIRATELSTGWLTPVTILKDVETSVHFQAASGYNPAIGDTLFELGTTEKEAIAIAAKLNLDSSFDGLVVNPKESAYKMVNGGYALGVTAEKIIDYIEDCENPNTGNSELYILGLISISAIACAIFCARRIYILNRI